ncbi:MAG: osmoprotectant transport system permease protein [Solirubrobacteraceae bacterium]|jgi:osmoprotectant transport system permease protein|nr:osmoprotectant transport system permease protein [Solirubrobacteraceae bacterium]
MSVAAGLTLAQSGPVIPDFGRGDECIRNNGKFCFNWFVDNFDQRFLPRVGEHLKMTAIAIVLGFAIAFAAALIAHRHERFELPFANIASLFYTVPSIAFFQIMVPITGIGWTSIEIALVSYTLLILFRNILTGLREVPADVKEAAEGMGLTRRQTLWRVELPLAMPAIVAGIRVATVTTISLATIAAFITPLGLGAPIFNAIQSGANTEFVGASLLAIGLALVADAVIVFAQRAVSPWTRARRAGT